MKNRRPTSAVALLKTAARRTGLTQRRTSSPHAETGTASRRVSTSRPRTAQRRRRGVAAVEFALVAPVFVVVVLGVAEASRLFQVQNQLALAAREGARLGAMDRTGILAEGQTTNSKITNDVRNFLTANGLPGAQTEVHIVNPDDSTTPFDLDAEVNELELFELRVELPYSAISGGGGSYGENFTMSAKVIFRNARASLVQ